MIALELVLRDEADFALFENVLDDYFRLNFILQPAASPASAILLLWLLGAGWVRLLGRRDSCWSAVLRVTAGIGAGS